MSDFLEKARKTGRIKELEEAFKEYPVEEYHQGKTENILQLEEESEKYYLYNEGDIVFVSDYFYDSGEKLKYETNEFLAKSSRDHLNKDSLVKTDILYRISEKIFCLKLVW